MGGCCSSSRKLQLRGAPVYYYYPPAPEENAFPSSRSSGLLLDLNLNMSAPDTYRPPPAPIPYDVVLGRPLSTDVGSRDVTLSGNFLGKHGCKDLQGANYTTQLGILLPSPKKTDVELLKSNPLTVAATDEEDVCPTCLEEYDSENPKIMTKCNHHFHLSCILEWMERSDTCPICDQEMIYEWPVGVASCD
ncbi:probable E3 ubiquitin-protein ligase RHB1A isoform X2 [Salvia miltiorrhiza]|uniref:probable E3 ubiquitin-protein ligase RHB1A isoform X2 n=1 Tax=Salvia miltiorrhiza TaxID=226208 RepID=UPI0025AD405C|nr:probable E3 ubiquitin-protein ligase RHB1A isoform X2 [Salvia miltiorrhiza]XP_057795237.1 probable E3 ubiquitin-protein ligase RHB1A isoform X2 [Salvia miltiorrhiza]XP_057805715.1 probable E3 ubiquitin-protein ligase RHB1A isoform X2 [Salvia miltiorrhiza]XP_057805716.1 probable E3 ubiquitin-protein ligase RHB1A isoform X2 [Salvia miltiorrhiza]